MARLPVSSLLYRASTGASVLAAVRTAATPKPKTEDMALYNQCTCDDIGNQSGRAVDALTLPVEGALP
jgi:hypothetical protein